MIQCLQINLPYQRLHQSSDLPNGDYAIVDISGHYELVGRIAVEKKLGVNMVSVEALYEECLFFPAFYNRSLVKTVTPCDRETAWDKQPRIWMDIPHVLHRRLFSDGLNAADDHDAADDEAAQ